MKKDKSEEVKDTSEVNRIIDDENRARIIDQLTELGVSDSSGLNDQELILKLSEILSEEHSKNIQHEANKAFMPLNAYAAQAHEDLKDKDFIQRLFNLNIPPMFLVAFRDEDAKIKDDMNIWKIVSSSGIMQYENPRDIFKNKMLNKKVYKRDLPREFRRI